MLFEVLRVSECVFFDFDQGAVRQNQLREGTAILFEIPLRA